MREDKNENRWDKLLQIHTMGRDDSRSDLYRYPYEPTPYCVLERMANTGMIRKGNTLLDYGCGKGRVDFFLSAQTRCQSIGVEYDDRIYAKAMENKKAAASGARTEFVLESAENFLPSAPEFSNRMREEWLPEIIIQMNSKHLGSTHNHIYSTGKISV